MTDPEIAALEDELRHAQLTASVGALDRLISDDLLFTGPDGTLATKADDLAAYRQGIMRVTAHEPEDLRVRRVGPDVAVVALRTRMAGSYAGAPFDAIARYTRVWARENGRWRIVAGHVSLGAVGDGAEATTEAGSRGSDSRHAT
ncbi:MAG TPA: nuclear transport factor 2 family protein [Gemmatimonadaceae bacterium]|nr:nuclear transport factor 2 family protein [Gemmatimonadaceae bacterium]